ncbi:hypothetical protein RND71_024096 [Anisodus tanguticus]|uniref:Uncharacterized protein n=1 Tax=Anisodus tanguticus TaxID=243964 RepID=A0AAE1RP29_9SOLA|nr:hypothetical protein RND71_024096 [Anisodus tanguticus]
MGDNPNGRIMEVKVNLMITDYGMPGMTCNDLLKKMKIFVDIVSIEYMTVKTKKIGCWNGKASLFFRQSHFPTHLNKPKPIFSAFLSCLCGPEFKVHSRLSSCRPQDGRKLMIPGALPISAVQGHLHLNTVWN